jgi:hypothetical protein
LLNLGSNLATYRSVLRDTDLTYQVSPGKVKESMVLSAPPTSASPSYVWTITAAGLTVQKDDFGDLEFLDSTGEVVFTMPVPTMWDSSGVDGQRQPEITNVPYDVKKAGASTYTLTLRPDPLWLNDPGLVYPVVLDPTVQPGADNIHSYKSDGTINNGTVWVGNSHQTDLPRRFRTVGPLKLRALLKERSAA